jgi:hypothetical protein
MINVYDHTDLWMIIPLCAFKNSLLDVMNVC